MSSLIRDAVLNLYTAIPDKGTLKFYTAQIDFTCTMQFSCSLYTAVTASVSKRDCLSVFRAQKSKSLMLVPSIRPIARIKKKYKNRFEFTIKFFVSYNFNFNFHKLIINITT